jgi:glycosyltransferase involved in cell wall biosynthesis
VRAVKRRLAIITEIIAPYRIPVFNELARRTDVEPYVIFLSETDKSLRDWQVYREEIQFGYEVLPSWRRRVGKANVLLNRQIGAALAKARPQAVVCGGYNYLASWSAALWARRHRVPLLLWSESTANDIRKKRAAVEFLKARFLKLCAGFIVPGTSARAYLESLGAPNPAIFTAPDAVDNDLFIRASEAARRDPAMRRRLQLPERYFLFVGRLVREKGVFDLLAAYAKLEPRIPSQIGLVFVGDGPRKDELLRTIGDLQLNSVHCFGFQDREALGTLYGLAEAFVLPTHSDPWGLVVNEGMACSLPVITTNVAGCAADLVRHGWNGLVVPPRDIGALCAAMKTFASDGALRARMGKHSRELISHYSPRACAAGIAEAALRLMRVS